eukprot:gene11258-11344_t
MDSLAYLDLADGRRIAHRFRPGTAPALVFLPGYMSDMGGTKAQALWDWCGAQGRACLLLDYSGCGASSGDFADGTLTRWCEEIVALVHHYRLNAVVLAGSSMGGWLMLLAAEALGGRVAGLVGIAPAPDFTEWGRDAAQQAALARGEVVLEDNPYGPEPTPMHPAFWADGQARRQLGGTIGFAGPVRLIHGQADADVPWQISLRLAEALCSDDVQVHLVKCGDHRLSRDADIALLLTVLADLVETAAKGIAG